MVEWPVLAGLTPDQRDQLLRAGRRRRFAKGETLCHHGDPADSLHLLAVGRVAVRVLTPQGDQAILNVLGPGQVFGELALIKADARRTATITALQACETIALRKTQFDALRAQHPEVDQFLLASLAAQVDRLSEHLLEVLFSPTPRRVLRRLLRLAHEFGDEPILVTQEELALMAGTTRATANEVLRDAERAGLIAIGRGRITVLDRRALARRIGPAR